MDAWSRAAWEFGHFRDGPGGGGDAKARVWQTGSILLPRTHKEIGEKDRTDGRVGHKDRDRHGANDRSIQEMSPGLQTLVGIWRSKLSWIQRRE